MLNRNSSVVMKEKKVSLMDLSTCRDTILASFEQYVTTDKLCGGTVEKGMQPVVLLPEFKNIFFCRNSM